MLQIKLGTTKTNHRTMTTKGFFAAISCLCLAIAFVWAMTSLGVVFWKALLMAMLVGLGVASAIVALGVAIDEIKEDKIKK